MSHKTGPTTSKQPSTGLPQASAEELALSQQLAQQIRSEIEQHGGAIDFARYMELALYAPALGYYSAGKQKFGDKGDFITAPELGPWFGRCLARQCQQVLAHLGGGNVLEAGAGSGALALQLLQELDRLGSLPRHYYILELSAELRARQQNTLQQAPELAQRVRWLDALPEAGFHGIVLANELLDAMPAERFELSNTGLYQLGVAWEDNGFAWRRIPQSDTLAARVAALNIDTDYVSEINFRAEAWVASIAQRLQRGLLLLIDYGFPRHEFYHPQRRQGTLMCHYRHRAHDNPLILTGLQDITTHIDFTAIAEAGHDAGLDVLGYTSQAAFLIALGLEQLAAESNAEDTRQHLELTKQIKILTLPSEMGELFKVIALGKGLDQPLPGFALQNRLASL